MKSLSAGFAKSCLWGSICILAISGLSAVAERAPTQSEIWTTQQESRHDHVVVPTKQDKPEQQIIRKLLRPAERSGLFELESDLHGLT